MIVLAMRTGIAPSAWAAEDPRTIETAFDLLLHDNGDDDKGDNRPTSG